MLFSSTQRARMPHSADAHPNTALSVATFLSPHSPPFPLITLLVLALDEKNNTGGPRKKRRKYTDGEGGGG